MGEPKNTRTTARICAIFLNNPMESFWFSKVKKLTNKEIKDSSIKTALNRLTKRKIIRKFKNPYANNYRYILNDADLATRYLNSVSDPKSKSIGLTPSPSPRDYLSTYIPQEKHHKFYQIKLNELEYARTEHLYSQPKERDRAKNRTYETRSFKITISQNSLNGVIYLLDTDWKQRLMDVYPELCRDVTQKMEMMDGHLGVSICADSWAGFKLKDEFLMTIFAHSHQWNELDVEGKEKFVNSMLQNLVKTSQDKTTFEATMSMLMEELLKRTDMGREQSAGMLTILQQLSDRLDKGNELQERSIKILETLVNGKKKEVEPDKPIKELDDHDLIMFG